jgi:two-component system, LytTR family, sensor kinase
MSAVSPYSAEPPALRVTRRTVAIVAAVWTLDGLLYLQQQFLYQSAIGDQTALPNVYYLGFKTPAIWAAFTLVLIAVRLVPRLRDRPLSVILGVHFALAVVLNAADVGIDLVMGEITGVVPPGNTFVANFFRQSTANIFLYMVTVAVLHALDYNRVSRMRAVHSAELQAQLSRARLEVLKMQLQPHFLFNTLHAMAALVQDDPRAAERMILRLGDLLRAAMDMAGRPVIPLADEINLLQAYLDIQQIRFRDRLTVRIEVPRELERAAVPNLILQPLVENAIKHGAAKQVGPTTIRVAVSRSNDVLALEVSNTGSPNGRTPELVEGMGMRNTKERLAELYPGRYDFTVTVRPEGGAVATIRIPHADADDDETGAGWTSSIPDSS